jgi:hypothetical protein
MCSLGTILEPKTLSLKSFHSVNLAKAFGFFIYIVRLFPLSAIFYKCQAYYTLIFQTIILDLMLYIPCMAEILYAINQQICTNIYENVKPYICSGSV